VPYTPPIANTVSTTAPHITWFPDIVANYHILPDTQHLTAINEYTGPEHLYVGNGHGLHISHTGTGTLSTHHISFPLRKVLCIPAIKKNLLSIQKFATDNSMFFEFWPNHFLVKDQTTKQILM
jgi:hypothetical protein